MNVASCWLCGTEGCDPVVEDVSIIQRASRLYQNSTKSKSEALPSRHFHPNRIQDGILVNNRVVPWWYRRERNDDENSKSNKRIRQS